VLACAHCAHVGEVADEVRLTGDQLQAPMGHALSRQAADEVQLVALPPVAQGQGWTPGAGLVVAGATRHPEPHILFAGALPQLQHHPIGVPPLAEANEPICLQRVPALAWKAATSRRRPRRRQAPPLDRPRESLSQG
jgi:hypothetical protein